MEDDWQLLKRALYILHHTTKEYVRRQGLYMIIQSCSTHVKNNAVKKMHQLGMQIGLVPFTDFEVKVNLNIYCEALWNSIQQTSYSRHISYMSMNSLYNCTYSKQDVILYCNKSRVLTLADFIKSIDYCLNFMNVIEGKNTELSSYIHILQKTHSLLINESKDKDILCKLGDVLDIFYKITDYYRINKQNTTENQAISILLKLSIEFLGSNLHIPVTYLKHPYILTI